MGMLSKNSIGHTHTKRIDPVFEGFNDFTVLTAFDNSL